MATVGIKGLSNTCVIYSYRYAYLVNCAINLDWYDKISIADWLSTIYTQHIHIQHRNTTNAR